MKLDWCTIGELPTSYKISKTYEEQLFWFCNKVEEIEKIFNDIVNNKLNEYILENFNDIMMDAVYDAETESLVLSLETEA